MQAKAVEFKIQGSEDLVLHEGKVKTVGDVYNEKLAKDFNFRAHQERHNKKKEDTNASICYHNLTHSSTSPGSFTATQTHRIVYQVKQPAEGTGPSTHYQASIASAIPSASWATDICKLIWMVRWTQKGLMPVKANIHLSADVTLLSGKALDLSKRE